MAITAEQVIAGIGEVIEEVTGVDAREVTVEKSFTNDLDIDSLSMVEIAVQLEDKYSVTNPDGEVANLRIVGDAVAFVQRMEREDSELSGELKSKFDGQPT